MAQLPDGALMQRAAAGLASVCAGLLGRVYGARVVILAGTGDNGGDALYAGARLAGRDARVTAIAAGSRLHEAALQALRLAGGRCVQPGASADADVAAGKAFITAAGAVIASADLIVDGILGIGGRGGLREPAATLAGLTEQARAAGAVVVATDLPSGVDADTGVSAGAAIKADVTVTFGAIKPGLLIDPGASHAGTVQLVDIGLDPHLAAPTVAALQSADVAAVLPRPGAESDKYRRGVLGVLAGSHQYTGAAVLCVGGAVHGGAGMVRLVSAPQAAAVVRQHWPECVVAEYGPAQSGDRGSGGARSGGSVDRGGVDRGSANRGGGDRGSVDRGGVDGGIVGAAGRVQAWVAGPGLGTGDDAAELLAAVLATPLPVLVDADGLTILARRPGLLSRPDGAPTLITPHAGELARLTGRDRDDIEARRLESARAAAAKLGVTVLLKGSTTVVATPEQGEPVLVNSTGTPWLATAGSGDVLSGLAGALLAQGVLPVHLAGAAAAFLHGLAGRIAADGAPIGASAIVTALPEAIRAVTAGPGRPLTQN